MKNIKIFFYRLERLELIIFILMNKIWYLYFRNVYNNTGYLIMAGCCFGKSNVLDDVVLTCLYWRLLLLPDKYTQCLLSSYMLIIKLNQILSDFFYLLTSPFFVGFKGLHIYIWIDWLGLICGGNRNKWPIMWAAHTVDM